MSKAWPYVAVPTTVAVEHGFHETKGTNPYRGKVIILADQNSASASEHAAMWLQNTLNAPIIGENTAGVVTFQNIWPLPLPRTGLIWYVPTARYVPKYPVEESGLRVDVYLAAMPPSLTRRS